MLKHVSSGSFKWALDFGRMVFRITFLSFKHHTMLRSLGRMSLAENAKATTKCPLKWMM